MSKVFSLEKTFVLTLFLEHGQNLLVGEERRSVKINVILPFNYWTYVEVHMPNISLLLSIEPFKQKNCRSKYFSLKNILSQKFLVFPLP